MRRLTRALAKLYGGGFGGQMKSEHDFVPPGAADNLWMPFAQMSSVQAPGSLRVIESGNGCWVTDSTGARLFDLMSGMWLKAIGYGRKEIADAVHEAMQGITFNPWGTTSRNTLCLSHRLAELAPDKESRIYLVSGGSEANETAIKMAKRFHAINGEPTRYKLISRRGSYHGGTHGTMPLGGGGVSVHYEYGPLQPGTSHVPQPQRYRCAFCKELPSCNLECASEVERVIQHEGPKTVAAFISEPISIPGGFAVPRDDYWPEIRRICDKYGVLLIFDEVVTGFGRTGKWFGSEHWGVRPDITTTAKALSSGYLPIGATIASKRVADAFLGSEERTFKHVLTFSGHPISCAAALANLDIIEREGLVGNSARMGKYLFEGLESLRKHPIVGDVRGGLGLLSGVELVVDRKTKERFPKEARVPQKLDAIMLKRGLMTRVSDVIPIVPPLVITKEEADMVVNELDASLDELQRQIS